MASQLHTYTAHVTWNGGREGNGSIRNDNSGQGFDLRVPPEFGGPGGALNPEELLTDAIAGCYSIIYGIVAGNRRLPFRGVQVEAVGTVDQSGVNFVYKSIALSPRITLGAEATDQDIATAVEMAHTADAYCIVTNAIRDKVQVSINPSVQREGTAPQETKPVTGDQSLSSSSSGSGASASSPGPVATGPGTGGTPQPDTAPKEETSYTGSEETEEAYPEAGEAEKPGSATGPEEGSGSGTASGSAISGTSLNTASPSGSGREVDVNPLNSEADDVTASSEETGDPEKMRVGAIPG